MDGENPVRMVETNQHGGLQEARARMRRNTRARLVATLVREHSKAP
jgi:hypothetical protein